MSSVDEEIHRMVGSAEIDRWVCNRGIGASPYSMKKQFKS